MGSPRADEKSAAPIPIVDQAVYNYILSIPTFRDRVLFSNHEDGWAANLGTTTEAVKAGAGDLGAMCKDNATEFAKYSMNFEDVQPVIHNDGTVTTPAGIPYVAIHQWDRIPSLKEKIEKKFGA